jgi:maltose/moltooligosaccharide transporter
MKNKLSILQVINMNVGFFGIQYSFGLQQSNMSPIYKYLGAEEASLPLLWLAGPMTGLIVQPIIGAMSDKTLSPIGRRTPYFLVGAVACSLGLVAMPYSSALWMAAGILWILDAANNITMEPYRAFVSDKLLEDQRHLGFLTQSAFTGFAQTLSYLTPSILFWAGMNKDATNERGIPWVVVTAFIIGSLFSITSILWTFFTTKETPLSEEETLRIKAHPLNVKGIFVEIAMAIREMPLTMRQMWWMSLFQWYGMFSYWMYITLSVSRSLFQTTDSATTSFKDAGLITGQMGALYNFIAFVMAFVLIRFSKRFGTKWVHSVCLVAAGLSMLLISSSSSKPMLFLSMLGIGLAWASIMGNPYVLLSNSIPPHRTGVYMGIFNMFIVIPMIIAIFTLPLLYERFLSANPQQVIFLAGILMLGAGVVTTRIKTEGNNGAVSKDQSLPPA